MTHLLAPLLALPPWLALTLVGLLPAAEASVMLGVAVPGETAVVLGGVLAHEGRLPLPAVVAVACVGAVAGDLVGFGIGRRWGVRMLQRGPRRLRESRSMDAALDLVRRRGGQAVFVGRFAAALRALVPGVAGIAGVRLRTFLPWNVAGGVLWATGAALVGYLAGAGWHAAAHQVGTVGLAVTLGVLVAVGVAVHRARAQGRRGRRAARERGETPEGDAPQEASSTATSASSARMSSRIR